MKKIVIAGGSGFVGSALAEHLSKTAQVIILSRNPAPARKNMRTIQWNGKDPGRWEEELEGADAIINLTGKNVNCRYTEANRKEILESRLESVKVLGDAFRKLQQPPSVWIQMSSATIYRHSEDKPNDETFGVIGDDFSMNVCKDWEMAFEALDLGTTRKIIMRTAIVIGKGGGAIVPLMNLVRAGLGGRQGSGRQMVSWIHIKDVVQIVDWMLNGRARGIYNVVSPLAVSNSAFMKQLRTTCGSRVGLPAPTWLLTLGAAMIGTETELVFKSRWVIPKRLIQEGYKFKFATLESAAQEIIN